MKKAPGRQAAADKKNAGIAAAKKTPKTRCVPNLTRASGFDPDALINSMGGMVFVASSDYRIEYMNETAVRKLGRDTTGLPCYKALHGLDDRCPWCLAGLVLQGQTVRQEVQGQLDKRWYSSVLTPLPRKDGSVAIQALVFDVTEQKLSEAALMRNEALLRSILQAAPTGVGMVRDRVIEWTNEQVSRITGYSPEELKGKSARIFYAGDEEFDRVGRHKYAEIQRTGTGSIATVWRRKDGGTVNIFLSSTPIDPGDLAAGVVFTALDITEKKKAQDDLWKSEEKYRALFENAVMGVFQSTPEGRFLSVNPATATMCGFDSPEEMIASVTDIAAQHYVDPAERDLFIRAIEEQGFVRNFEHRTYRKDGSIFWVSVNARAVRDRQGRITHYEGTHEDIQARKEAEAALRASEERFSTAFRSSPAPLAISTIDEGCYIDANDRFLDMFGYHRDEIIGRTSRDLHVWLDISERKRLIGELRENGSVRSVPVLRKNSAGKVRHTLWSAEIIRLGGRDVLLTLHQDITEQKEAEERLRQSEEKYRHLFENSLVGVFQSTLEGRYISVNPAFARMYGFESPKEVVSSVTSISREIFVYAEDRKRCLAILQETGILERFEARTRRKDGSVIWTAINSRIVRDAGGQPLFIEGVIEDITQRKRAEEALKLNELRLEALQTLNQMNRATVQELCDFALEEGVRLTGSRIGYLAFLNKDETVMTMFSWSRAAMERCSVSSLTDIFPVANTGLWGEAVRQRRPIITNDYAAPSTLKKGVPEGHVPILRHMNVPVLDGERIVAVVGVGNKEADYDESDVLQLTLLAQGMWRIIQRRRSEEDLRASEERFFKVFQSNPIPMTIATLDEGRFIDVNERAIELSGYSRGELIGRTSLELGLWAYPEERDRLIAQIREQGFLRDGLAHFRTRDGRVAPALWSADRIRLGDDEVILTTIHDISQQVEAQEKLRLSEEKYRLLAENVTDVIWTANLDLAFTYVSPSSERLFGWSPSEWMSKPLRDFLAPSSLEAAERMVREEAAMPGGTGSAGSRVVTLEMELTRKDGTSGWYEVSAQMIRNEDGTPRSIIGVTRDIAERKTAEKQNALLEQQLRQAQKMEAVGTLAGGIAHDFNNILFAVIGYAELCLQDTTNDESRWNLSQILSACSRAKTLVSQILAFSRQVEQERKPLDVVPLAKEAVKFLRSSLPVTIDLHLDIAAANSVVLADATEIHQVLMNLCTNAAHAMRASGGRLAIRIDNAPPPPGLVPKGQGPRPAGFLRLSVSDTGHGIEPDRISRIFDPFFTTKAPGEGTGLGLSVVYGIVKALGGTIRVDSTPHRGSAFEIYLPSAADRGLEPEKPAEPIPRGSERVLFVDDEGHLVEVMGQVLSALGYRVTTVRESRNALRLFRENPESFDLVITDMTMPDMTGAELAREILRFRPQMPIILCTGYSELISEEEALRMGIRRFLMKPLFMGDVAREIRAVLDGSNRGTAS
jgi:PAS domain S-box-containing protein